MKQWKRKLWKTCNGVLATLLPGWAFPAWMKTEMNRLSVNMAYQPQLIR